METRLKKLFTPSLMRNMERFADCRSHIANPSYWIAQTGNLRRL